jgi:hypothetical protein
MTVRMQVRKRTILAWSLWLGTLGFLAGGLAVALAVTRPLTAQVLVDGAADAATWLLFATLGLVLTLRRPANPIGWLYAGAGLAWTAYVPWDPWVDQLQRTHRPLPPVARLAPWPVTTSGRSASPWPSPCRCCCCPTGGCVRAAGGRSRSPPSPARR